ncbi:MAG: pitrilysin family protein [bacterium]
MQRRIGFWCAIVMALLLVGLATAQDVDKLTYPKLNPLEIPKVEKLTLDNGMRLYLLEDHSLPILRASVRVNCGTYLEPADKVGLAEICATVMRTGGTEKWSGDEIDEMLEGIGGSVETSIDRTSGSASVRVLSDYTDLGLEVLAEVLRRPRFDEDKIDLAKVQERSAISRRNDEPFDILVREFRKAIFGAESPYARHTEYASINAVSRDDLLAFHDRWYQPESIQLAVWGDFKRDELLAKLNQYFGDWQRGGVEVPRPPKVDYSFDRQVYFISKPDAPQAYILMGHIGGYVTDPDYADRIVMNSILGESFGSRVVNNVRSRLGLAYSTAGNYTANIEYPGIFYLFASTKPETMSQALFEMIKQTKSMETDPPTDIEMKKGKDGYLNSFVFQYDSKGEVISRIMNYDFYGLPEDLPFKQKEAVEQVTKEDVVEAAAHNLKPDSLRVVVLGNVDQWDMKPEEWGLGPVVDVDITIPSGEEKLELVINEESLAKGQALLKQAVVAAGGADKIKAIKSSNVTATFTLSTPQGDLPLTVEAVEVYPDKNRSVVSIMGQKMYDIRDGDHGWKTGARGEVMEKTAEDLAKEDREQLRDRIQLLQHADDPTLRLVYESSGDFDGRAVDFVVVLDDQDENLCRLAIATDDHQLIGMSYWGESPMGEGTIDSYFSNFKEVSGVMVPFTTVRNLDGSKFATIEMTEIVFNGAVPADAFAKPE